MFFMVMDARVHSAMHFSINIIIFWLNIIILRKAVSIILTRLGNSTLRGLINKNRQLCEPAVFDPMIAFLIRTQDC